VVTQGGKPIAIKRFRFKNLPIECDQGDVLLSSRIKGEFPVRDNDRFHATATDDDPPGEAKLRGKVVNPSKVKGRVKAEGSFGTGMDVATGCEGSKRFVAS
jgi:hypothetical protein